MENIAFTFSHPERGLVEYMQDKFWEGNNFLETHSVEQDEIIELNGKYVLRVFMTPRQMKLEV